MFELMSFSWLRDFDENAHLSGAFTVVLKGLLGLNFEATCYTRIIQG